MINRSTVPCRYGVSCRKIGNGCSYLHNEQIETKEKGNSDDNYHSKSHSQSNYFRQQRHKHTHQKQAKTKEKQSKEEPQPSNAHLKRGRDRDNSSGQEDQNRVKKFKANKNQRQYTKRPAHNIKENNCKQHYSKFYTNFCREYHTRNICKYLPNCLRSHEFSIEQPERLKRLVFNDALRLLPKSKMTATIEGDRLCYTIRGKKSVSIFGYWPEQNKLQLENEYQVERADESYFDNRGSIFYCSFSNKSTTFQDIFIYDMNKKTMKSIQNAHEKTITGILQLTESTIISVSLDGQLKAWATDSQGQISNNIVTSTMLKECFNPQNHKLSLHFIERVQLGEKMLILVGTNDSRLLVFSSDVDKPYSEITLPKVHLVVSKVKVLIKENEVQQIFVMAQDAQKLYVFKGQLSSEAISLIYQNPIDSTEAMHTFEIYEDLLMVCQKDGIILYRLPNTRHKVGCILQSGIVRQINVQEYELRSTGVKCPILAVLSLGAGQKNEEGHFSLYLIK